MTLRPNRFLFISTEANLHSEKIPTSISKIPRTKLLTTSEEQNRQRRLPKKTFRKAQKNVAKTPYSNREAHSHSEKSDKEVKRMQSQPDTRPVRRNMPTDEDISDFLIIISVIAKRLAGLIMKEGERQDEQNE